MSTDALLTLAAAVIAILTLLSAEGREDLRLRFTWPLRLIALTAAIILVGIKLSPVWIASGLPVLAYWRWGFDPEIASFVTLALATVTVVGGIIKFRVKPQRIEQFSRLAERLLFAEKYSELMFLVERHYRGIRQVAEGQDTSSRLRKRLKPDGLVEIFIGSRRVGGNETREEWERYKSRVTTRMRRWVADRLPDHEERQRRAKRLLERVFFSESFVDYLSKARPDFALKVLELKVPFFINGFLDLLIKAWMKNPNSVLYEETFQNQNTTLGHRYRFEPLNPVLWYLFGEPFRADVIAIYKPVGDFVLDDLERLRRVPEDDPHRRPQTGFIEEGRWHSPIHLGLRLFDFWITESLHRGTHWHGWLMYWEDCVKHIVGNMSNLERVDHTHEFPTPYHYLLYEIFAAFGNWIEDATRLDQDLESVKIERVDMQAGAVLKSAVISLAHMLRTVLESPNVTVEFKARALLWVLELYEHAVKREDLKKLYEMAVLRGGQRFGRDDAYHAALRETLLAVDRTRLYGEPGSELLDLVEQTVGRR